MRVLVTGDRNWTSEERIRYALSKLENSYNEDFTLIHGAARGADTIAETVAKSLGWTIERYPADWQKYGRAAGPVRNKQMLVEGKPDVVLAFHDDFEHSKGTDHMVRLAR